MGTSKQLSSLVTLPVIVSGQGRRNDVSVGAFVAFNSRSSVISAIRSIRINELFDETLVIDYRNFANGKNVGPCF